MDDEYEKLLQEEQAEIANSIEIDAALETFKKKNGDFVKEISQVELGLASVTSEYDTISQFIGTSQEQCFTMKALVFKIDDEMKRSKEMITDLDEAISYWQKGRAENDETSKKYDGQLGELFQSPWASELLEAKKNIENDRVMLAEKQRQLSEVEDAKKFKSPRTSVDDETLEKFRSMVRSELQLNPARAQRSTRLSTASTQPPRMEEAVVSQSSQRLSQPTPVEDLSVSRLEFDAETSDHGQESQHDAVVQHQEEEYMDQNNELEEEPQQEEYDDGNLANYAAMEVEEINDENPFAGLVESPVKATPPNAKSKPIQNYTPRKDDHLFKVPENPRRASPVKENSSTKAADSEEINFLNISGMSGDNDFNSQDIGGTDFMNFLGNTGSGTNDGNPGFSFMNNDAEHTSNSDRGGAFFADFASPQADKDVSNGFLF